MTWLRVSFQGKQHSFPLWHRDLSAYAVAEYGNKERGDGFVLDSDRKQPEESYGAKVFIEEEAAARARLQDPDVRIIGLQLYSDATQVGLPLQHRHAGWCAMLQSMPHICVGVHV